ncbi:MAG TPA: hypothetical protein VM824_04735 [Thermoleophilaceae bacterium]|nr:hypothetical protein [Thermoleophilaceae bacterium]
MLLLVQVLFERIEAAAPELAVRGEPGVQLGERLGTQPVPPPLPVAPNPDEPRLAQHAQVLRHARLAQLEVLDEVADGALALAKKL